MIQEILDKSLELKLTQLADVAQTRERLWKMGLRAFAEEFSTIRLNLGRMAGHTSAMCKNAKRCDLILTPNVPHSDYIRRHYGNSSFPLSLDLDRSLRGRGVTYRYVWLDNASYATTQQLDRMYSSIMASTLDYSPVFILLG